MPRGSSGVRLASNGAYWQAVWRDLSGSRKVKSLGPKSGMSRAAADRACRQIEAQHIVSPGARNVGKAPTLEAWRDEYFKLRAGELKDGTETLHRQTFDRLCARFGAGLRLDRIDKAAAAAFKAWLVEQPDQRFKAGTLKLSASSVARHIRDCKVIFGHAARLDLIPINPFAFVKAGSVSIAKEWRQVTEADLGKILAACPNADWSRAFALARLGGLRRGECLRLTWGDVDLARMQLRILPEEGEDGARREGTKQRARTVPVSPALARILRESWEGRTLADPVCRIPTENIHRQAVTILVRAGVGRYSKPFHTLKKCLASDWLAAGHPVSDVAQWLGDSVDVLVKHYARFLQSSADRVTGKRDEMAELRAMVVQLQAENQQLKGGAA